MSVFPRQGLFLALWLVLRSEKRHKLKPRRAQSVQVPRAQPACSSHHLAILLVSTIVHPIASRPLMSSKEQKVVGN